ncbi:MAG: DUF5334 family protein [Gammaproteobacteria bacterium]
MRSGEEIESYDYGSDEYRTGEAIHYRKRSSVEVGVYDNELREVRTFEMEGDRHLVLKASKDRSCFPVAVRGFPRTR